MVKNPHASAGDNGFDPWSKKIPHASEQLSLCPTTCWACALEPGNRNYWSLRAPEPELCNKRSPHTTTKEKPRLTTTRAKPKRQRRPNTAKNKEKIKLLKKNFSSSLLTGASVDNKNGLLEKWNEKKPYEYKSHFFLLDSEGVEFLCQLSNFIPVLDFCADRVVGGDSHSLSESQVHWGALQQEALLPRVF